MKGKEKEKFETNTQTKAIQAWFLTVSLNQIYSQVNERVISNLKLKDQKKIDLRMFCEKLILWFTISSES